ncbi:MAG: MATE family efflux transporter [Acidobacteriaceae bacterium]|nr:MATE family efflux transporter [Acidobacteriaceae bacterium]
MTKLAWPIVLAELGWVVMGIVDTMVVGRLPASADSIAAVSLGGILFYTLGIFGSGLLLGLDTLVSHSFGAREHEDGRRSLVNALYLTPPLGVALMGLLWGAQPLLELFGERPEVMALTRPYLSALTWSTWPLLIYFALRRYLQAIDVVRPVMFALLSANLVNLGANIVLVFGNLGARPMGVTGSAWATVISRIYMAAVLAFALWRVERRSPPWPLALNLRRMAELLKLGVPAGAQILLEAGVFAVAAVLIGKLDAASLAAHQIALNAAAFTYMVTLGIGSAGAVRVGQALGRNDWHSAAISGWTAVALGASFMICAAVTFCTIPVPLTRVYTSDSGVIQISISLLFVAGLFQVFDGCQAVLAGVLRGAGDTHSAMYCHFAGYWLIGLPLGYWLCYSFHLGARGIWYGFLGGLILIASILMWMWRRKVQSWMRSDVAVESLRY